MLKSGTSVIDSIDSGNTKTESIKVKKKKSCDASKRFAFTFNNYSESDYSKLLRIFQAERDAKWVIGQEVGASGTPHLQGYIEVPNRIRPKRYFGFGQIHWEIAKGCRQLNVDYCCKEGRYVGNLKPTPTIKYLHRENFYTWQEDLYIWCQEEPNDRSIVWVTDYEGNAGKTSWCKTMVIQHDAIVLEGKSTDMFHGLVSFYERKGYYPSIVLIDIPRESLGYINYAAIEKIKNGLLFSGKYESNLLVFNPPHVIVFANNMPKLSAFSLDRWNIFEIDDNKELVPIYDVE